MGTEKRPVRLTNKFVAGLTGEDMWWDDDPKATGFGVRSYPGGGRSFFIDYRLNGRQRRYTIGPFPRWSAEAAREDTRAQIYRLPRNDNERLVNLEPSQKLREEFKDVSRDLLIEIIGHFLARE